MPEIRPSENSRPSDQRILARDLDWFTEWMKSAGEPVPDFGSMRSMPDLPPLLEFLDGRTVRTETDWERRKEEIRRLLCHYILGSFPDSPPQLVRSKVLEEVPERAALRQVVQLTFDTNPQASIALELLLPEGPGPFPVFMTQTNHRRHALLGLSRGYLCCVYPGADVDDQTEVFRTAYPECDWGLIPRRAWLASRVLDYLQTLDEADMEKVCIAGHSRNGKQSLVAAAFDSRIKAVVSSSSGSGGSCPFRFNNEPAFEESVEFTSRQRETAHWFHPRIRLFTGREDRLPIDIHGLFGLIAPRHCLISTALNDGVETTFSIERTHQASMKVYRFLGKPEALRIRWRYGGHEWNAETGQAYFDWFDKAFGRGSAEFPEEPIHRFEWDVWKRKADPKSFLPPSISTPDPEGTRRKILWGLGKRPPSAFSQAGSYGAENEHVARMMDRDKGSDPGDGMRRVSFSFGDYVRGHFYFKEPVGGPLPTVIWLHPYSYSTGHVGAYVEGERVYRFLARHGFGVFAFDQIGFGTRILEGRNFYRRHPSWSKLGKMVHDVQSAVDCLVDPAGKRSYNASIGERIRFPSVDARKIYCLGYSLGGMVALYAAALDERIAGVASFCGFTPLRNDTDSKPTGGIRRLWEWHALQPLLGFYDGREKEIPYDFEDLLSLIAPRPCLLVTPLHDREADREEVLGCIGEAEKHWSRLGAKENLSHLSPADYNRFEAEHHRLFLEWIGEKRGF